MRIFYDFELKDLPDKRVLTPMVAYELDELRKYIIGLLSVFSDIMSTQESYFGSYVCINILTAQSSIEFINYSPSLIKKMEVCIKDDDFKYINLKLTNIMASFLN